MWITSLVWDKSLFVYYESLNHWVINDQNKSYFALLNFACHQICKKDKEIAFKPNKLFLHKRQYNRLISVSSILSTRVDFYQATKALMHSTLERLI